MRLLYFAQDIIAEKFPILEIYIDYLFESIRNIIDIVKAVFLIPKFINERAKSGAIHPPICVPVIENAIANDLFFLNHKFIIVMVGNHPDNADPKLTKK